MKLRKGKSKWILRQILNRYLPKDLFERNKMGFVIPIDSWLKGPLRVWAQDKLSLENLKKYEMLDNRVINKAWNNHLIGKSNFQYPLWNVLMFLEWYEKNN